MYRTGRQNCMPGKKRLKELERRIKSRMPYSSWEKIIIWIFFSDARDVFREQTSVLRGRKRWKKSEDGAN
jgi:hypothetical protein